MASKRNYEKMLKEEQEAALVFQDFIETFQTTSQTSSKTFVRSATLYSDDQENTKIGQFYKPKPLIKSKLKDDVANVLECAKILKTEPLDKSKKHDKPKSNLDILKEELKLKHSERGEKEKKDMSLGLPALSYFEGGDPHSTNLFITNLDPKITENHLMLQFGAFGPLASVKIMWPRGDEKFRNTNCGFVAFMSRKDAERALRESKHREDMRIGWGKSVEIPPHPIYIPNNLLKLYLPPPLTGLPFNAQLPNQEYKIPNDIEELSDFLKNCFVKVTVPLNKKVLMLVHRMVEFVIIEGPLFEAFVMNREIGNPDFNFLFDCQSPVHVYYRWKIFSILNGDSQKSWTMKPFRMFKGGSIWLPPTAPNYCDGMPDELIKENNIIETVLTETQSKKLIVLIRNLTTERSKIAEAMYFCLNVKNAINDCFEIITESLTDLRTNPVKRIARLYLLSDVLTNCIMKRIKVEMVDKETVVVNIFQSLYDGLYLLNTEKDKNNFKSRIKKVLHHWDIGQIFSSSFIQKIELIFQDKIKIEEDDTSSLDEPLDGANLLKRSLESDIGPEVITPRKYSPDKKTEDKTNISDYFIPSKWDTVDPEEVEAQAMSTEKLYYLELKNKVDQTVQKKKKKKKRH